MTNQSNNVLFRQRRKFLFIRLFFGSYCNLTSTLLLSLLPISLWPVFRLLMTEILSSNDWANKSEEKKRFSKRNMSESVASCVCYKTYNLACVEQQQQYANHAALCATGIRYLMPCIVLHMHICVLHGVWSIRSLIAFI